MLRRARRAASSRRGTSEGMVISEERGTRHRAFRMPEERLPWLVLGAAMAASAVFQLWLTRDLTFHNDELRWFAQAGRGFGPAPLLADFNGHLILLPRLLYLGSLSLVGAEYLPFRL